MNISLEEALEIVELLINNSLSKAQKLVFCQCWEGKSYQEIARSSGYQFGYIRDVGHKLWQTLSLALGQKVTKTNFSSLIKQQYLVIKNTEPNITSPRAAYPRTAHSQLIAPTTIAQVQDWEEVIDVSTFFGRRVEIDTLKQWLIHENCRLVALTGMGGVGKTAIAVRCVQAIQNEFQCLIWRSLRNVPPIKELLADLIIIISQQQESALPTTVEGLLSCLMKYLRQYRCLLILDNYDSVLQSGGRAGQYCPEYEGYEQLLRRVADEIHQSCVLITTREKPIGLVSKEGANFPVRSLSITGLSSVTAKELLKIQGLLLGEEETKKLVKYYSGNPLALKIVSVTIKSLYKGDVHQFLAQGRIVFGEIWDLIDKQFNRLSATEKQLSYWLAKHPNCTDLHELQQASLPFCSHRELLEALHSLEYRSLLERNSFSFTQPTVLLEYIHEVTSCTHQQCNMHLAVAH